jgi:uncharacterized protein DUF885
MTNNTMQETFNSLQEQYYSAWFRFHPEMAVHVGINGYEEFLTPFNDEEIGALISLNQKIIFSLDEINVAQLNVNQRLDYSILYNSASIELHELIERDWRFLMPQKYLPLEAIHQLINRPVENRHRAIKHRMQMVPEYLRSAKKFLLQQPENIPQNWVTDAISGASSGAEYFRSLVRNPVIIRKFKNPSRLQPIFDEAAHAMEDYEKFLRKDILPRAQGSFSCGEHHFNSMLNNWHCLEIDSQQLYAFGKSLFDETLNELKAVCKKLPGSDEIQEQLANIRHQHPSVKDESLLNAYRSRMNAAYHFVVEKALVTVPDTQALKVIETPTFLRHEIPFAAYEEPTYSDAQQQGYYYVTPVRSEGHLLEHNWTSIDLTCVHEAFPGHHLQFVTANINPQNSLPRLLNSSATLYEGWALYCEDMMQEQGFLDKPEHHFMMLRDRLWRALRVMLDVELHTKDQTIKQAAQRMCDELGFSIDQAEADLSWYSQSPTVPMSYATGWALIKALREEESKKEGFSLKNFHDRLLSVGSCALPLVIKYEFGDSAWKQAHEKVFKTC